ncbi:flagellar hook-associated protein FlgK [Fictibacillus sp. NPDC058756]|uniref:flagellar hook-associated protein FlgK n=1 Tax=Fictibacillus sp. NPDC058756 TaxID=3346625 RepID=UPI0036B57751
MRSTFHGLETARRGMFTQQTALQVTGNNISNANTPGYSRQRVNFGQTEPYPAAAINRPQIPGQMGTGVKAESIQRVRESFLDSQFRGENNKLGYWSSRSEALAKMEDIMNEPSDNGLAKTLDRFWQSLQDLSVNPEDSGARSVVRQRGIAVVETFNYLSNSLSAIQGDLKTQANHTAGEINNILKEIDEINIQIREVEPHDYLPNDLYDKRDVLVDKLSTLVNIEVEKDRLPDKPLTEGQYKIHLLKADGTRAATLLDSSTSTINNISIEYGGPNGEASEVKIGTAPALSIKEFSKGQLKGVLESYGFMNGANAEGTYPKMLAHLDEMAYNFANAFNDVHKAGWSLDSINSEPPAHVEYNFFDVSGVTAGKEPLGAAKAIKLHSDLEGKPGLDHIAAAFAKPGEVGYSGDGSNALNLANVKNDKIFSGSATLQSYYEGAIGEMAVEAQQAVRLTQNSFVLTDAVEQRRTSVSGVSLDEEMTNMIQFQHAYNASARNITVIDEMLDKIINGMGVVGR